MKGFPQGRIGDGERNDKSYFHCQIHNNKKPTRGLRVQDTMQGVHALGKSVSQARVCIFVV
jgi:hypothetical protein